MNEFGNAHLGHLLVLGVVFLEDLVLQVDLAQQIEDQRVVDCRDVDFLALEELLFR